MLKKVLKDLRGRACRPRASGAASIAIGLARERVKTEKIGTSASFSSVPVAGRIAVAEIGGSTAVHSVVTETLSIAMISGKSR